MQVNYYLITLGKKKKSVLLFECIHQEMQTPLLSITNACIFMIAIIICDNPNDIFQTQKKKMCYESCDLGKKR